MKHRGSVDESDSVVVTMLDALSTKKDSYERTLSMPTFPNLRRMVSGRHLMTDGARDTLARMLGTGYSSPQLREPGFHDTPAMPRLEQNKYSTYL